MNSFQNIQQSGRLLEEPVGLLICTAKTLFDYIHADLPFIASDLIEVRNIVHKFGVGQILKDRTPKALSKQIESLPPFDKPHDQAKTELAKGATCFERGYRFSLC